MKLNEEKKDDKNLKDLEIIQGIAQAAANAYDGALDDKGEPIKIGMKREEGHPVLDSRQVDGFKVRISGSSLIVTYHSEIRISDVYETKFENETAGTIADYVKWLKKEFRKVTGKSLSLKMKGEPEMKVENTSMVRAWVTAWCLYDIGGLSKEMTNIGDNSSRELDKNFKSFLEKGGWGSAPKNKNQKGAH